MSETLKIIILSLEETRKLAHALSASLKAGMVVGLSGGLGVGKTELVRCLCREFGITETIASPTYTLENIYELKQAVRGINQVHHWDLYRVASGFFAPEIMDYQRLGNSLVFVEWPEKTDWIENLLSLRIHIDFYSENTEQRVFFISGPAVDVVALQFAENRMLFDVLST